MNNYTINLETGRVELTGLDFETYSNLEKELKKKVKSYFIFIRACGLWASKSRKNNIVFIDYTVKNILKELGLNNQLVTGEEKSYEGQLEYKQQKAEKRKDKYLHLASKLMEEGKNLQSEFNRYSGDISYFTQPNINSSKGRSFTNQRNKVIQKYEKGFEKYEESKEYEKKAKTSKKNSEMQELKDVSYLSNKIDECNKNLRSYERNLKTTTSEEYINKLNYLKRIEIDKKTFFSKKLDELGGIKFSKDVLKHCTHIKTSFEFLKIIRRNIKTVTVKTDFGTMKCKYSDIIETK